MILWVQQTVLLMEQNKNLCSTAGQIYHKTCKQRYGCPYVRPRGLCYKTREICHIAMVYPAGTVCFLPSLKACWQSVFFELSNSISCCQSVDFCLSSSISCQWGISCWQRMIFALSNSMSCWQSADFCLSSINLMVLENMRPCPSPRPCPRPSCSQSESDNKV